MSKPREVSDALFYVRLVVGLSLLCALITAVLYLHFFIFKSEAQTLDRYVRALFVMFTDRDAALARNEMLLYCAAGAAAPLLIFLSVRYLPRIMKLVFSNGG